MDLKAIKKAVEEFEKYGGKNDWGVVMTTGIRYSHLPPHSLLKISEEDNVIYSFYYESQRGPDPTVCLTVLDPDDVSCVMTWTGELDNAKKMLKKVGVTNYDNMPESERPLIKHLRKLI